MILLRGIQARALDLLYVHGGCRYNMLSIKPFAKPHKSTFTFISTAAVGIAPGRDGRDGRVISSTDRCTSTHVV